MKTTATDLLRLTYEDDGDHAERRAAAAEDEHAEGAERVTRRQRAAGYCAHLHTYAAKTRHSVMYM